jgi:ferritin-like metal-binding protein YciE
MNEARQRIIRSLGEAHAAEQALEEVVQAQIAMAPRGRYRKTLQTHLRETRDQAAQIEARLRELGRRSGIVQRGMRLLEGALGQGLAPSRAALGLLRGSGGPERVLDDAEVACAARARGIARYTGVEGLAESIGDRRTAKLAASIRSEQQLMLEQLLDEIPSLIGWVVDADVRGKAAPTISQNGRTKRSAGEATRKLTAKPRAKRKARQSRRTPPVVRSEPQPATPVVQERPADGYRALAATENGDAFDRHETRIRPHEQADEGPPAGLDAEAARLTHTAR